jgi:hypothetical protein
MDFPLPEEKLDVLPFKDISWKKSEKICSDLLASTKKIEYVREYLNQGDGQEGIDIYALDESNDLYLTMQCKNVKNFGPQQITSAVKKFVDGEFYTNSKTFILATRASLGTKACEAEIKIQFEFLKSKNIKFRVWDSRIINRLLKKHPVIVYDAFNEATVRQFNGEEYVLEIRKLVANRIPPPSKLIYDSVPDYIERSIALISERETVSHLFAKGKSLRSLIEEQDKNRYFLLLSDGGNGKSIELDNLAHYYSSPEKQLYPVKVSLRNYPANDSLESYISKIYPNWDRIDEAKLLILFDGLDEVTENLYNELIKRLNVFVEARKKVTIVVSSRTNFYDIQKAEGQLRDFNIITLSKITYTDIEKFAAIKLGFEKDKFLNTIRQRGFGELLHSPFYLIELVALFTANDSSAFPKTKDGIMAGIVDQIILREEIKFALNNSGNSISKERKIKLLKKVALSMTLLGQNTIAHTFIEKLFPESKDQETLKYTLLQNIDGIYQFPHNLIQEYLTALSLVNLTIEEIVNIVAYKPDNTKVKSKWYNAISFYLLLLQDNKTKYQDFVNWILANEPEVLINIEADKLHVDARYNIFVSIIEKYKRMGIYIPYQYFSTDKFIRFSGKTIKVLKYILSEIKSNEQSETQLYCLDLIREFDNLFGLEQEVKEILLKCAVTPSELSRSQYEAIKTLSEFGNYLNLDECYQEILDQCPNLNNYLVRKGIHALISKMQFKNEYLSFAFKSIDLINKEKRPRDVVFGDEYSVTNIFLIDKSFNTISSVLKFIVKRKILHRDRTRNFNLNSDFLKNFTQNCISVYRHEKKIYTELIKFINGIEKNKIDDDNIAEIGAFFKETGTQKKAFLNFYKKIPTHIYSWRLSELIASFADWSCLKRIYREYEKGIVTEDFVRYWRSNIRDNKLHDKFYEYINQKSGQKFEYTPYVSWEKRRAIQEKKDQELLLDKEAFFKELATYFTEAGLKTLSKDYIWQYKINNVTEEDLGDTVTLDLLRDWSKEDGYVTLSDVIAHYTIEKNWEHYLITEIYGMAIAEKEIHEGLKQSTIEYLKNNIVINDLKNAITDGTYTYFSAYLNQFNSIWDLDWNENVLLDILHVDAYGFLDMGNSPNEKERPFEYVLRKINDSNKIKNRVLENLKRGNLAKSVQGSHFRLSAKLHITEAKTFIYQELTKDRYNPFDKTYLADIYLGLNGTLTDFIPIYDIYKGRDDWFWYLSEKLVPMEPGKVYKNLNEILKNDDFEPLRQQASVMLLKQGQYAAIEYFCQYIVKHNDAPFDYHNWDKLHTQRFPIEKSLKILFETLLIAFSRKQPERARSYEHLDQTITVLINYIGQHSEDAYKQAMEMYDYFIQKNINKYPKVKNLQYTVLSFERTYYKNKEENISIDDVVKITETLE